MGIEAGDDVFVDDGDYIVGHVRRANRREVVIFVEDQGDFLLPREAVKTSGNNYIVLLCRQLPLKLRAAIGHLHGEEYDTEA